MKFLAIKQYIVSLVISHSQNPELMEREKVYLNKLNIILVQVNYVFVFRLMFYEVLFRY
jgi:hypothetical protein